MVSFDGSQNVCDTHLLNCSRISYFKMLRQTKRLSMFLASNGHALLREKWDVPFVEAEFAGMAAGAAVDAASFSAVPPGFDIFRLNQLMASEVGCLIVERGGEYPTRDEVILPDDVKIDILWLSATEFITPHTFEFQNELLSVLPLCKLIVKLCGISVDLRACALLPIADGVAPRVRPPLSSLPLRFCSHILTSTFHLVTRMEFSFWSIPPMNSVLSLIPTMASQNVMMDFEVAFEGVVLPVLHASGEWPVHRHVVICLEGRLCSVDGEGISYQELNDVLSRYQHRLRLPRLFLYAFECAGETFAANPAIESLTLSASKSAQLSPKVLDGLARNQGIRHLTIVWGDWTNSFNIGWGDNWTDHSFTLQIAAWIIPLFRTVVLRSEGHLQRLTFEFSGYPLHTFRSSYESTRFHQTAFEQLTQYLDLHLKNDHRVSNLQLTFPTVEYKTCIRSNRLWDSRFSPALVLNCLHGQQSYPSQRVSGLAIRTINQGALFRNATNLVPWDLSMSSASAIYDVVRLLTSEWP
jgi:hypothetical protein